MGVSHATSGALVGLAVAELAPWAAGVEKPTDAVTFAILVAGYAMLSDLDHDSSTATMRFGWASWLAARIVQPLSAAVFKATATKKDRGRGREGTHRYLTHTAVFAVSLGVAVNVFVASLGTWALWSVVFVGVALAVKGIDHLIPGPPSLLAAAGITAGLYWVTGTGTAWAGTAVAIGIVVHCVGDALTLSGCPIAWPLTIRGQRWAPLGPPVRFRTGGPTEAGILLVMTAAVVWLAAGVVPAIEQARDQLWAAVSPWS